MSCQIDYRGRSRSSTKVWFLLLKTVSGSHHRNGLLKSSKHFVLTAPMGSKRNSLTIIGLSPMATKQSALSTARQPSYAISRFTPKLPASFCVTLLSSMAWVWLGHLTQLECKTILERVSIFQKIVLFYTVGKSSHFRRFWEVAQKTSLMIGSNRGNLFSGTLKNLGESIWSRILLPAALHSCSSRPQDKRTLKSPFVHKFRGGRCRSTSSADPDFYFGAKSHLSCRHMWTANIQAWTHFALRTQ